MEKEHKPVNAHQRDQSMTMEIVSSDLPFSAKLIDSTGGEVWISRGRLAHGGTPLANVSSGLIEEDRDTYVDLPVYIPPQERAILRLYIDLPSHRLKDDLSVLKETQHRARNLVSLVIAIASQSFAGHVLDPTAAKFMDRLASLDAVVRVGCEAEGDDCPVPVIVAQITRRFQDPGFPQFRTEGPDISLPLRWAHTLALVVHELATNAIRHGALRDRDGRVDVTWQWVPNPSGGARFVFHWREHVARPIVPSTRKGFGSRLLRTVIEQSRQCSGSMQLNSGGLVFRWSVTLRAIDIPTKNGGNGR